MSKVKIQGHASGTGVLTVTAPNTSTDRTITLPDSTGTILDSTSTLDATKLSGALPALDGSSLTGTGSPSITDNGNATAITIDASEDVKFHHNFTSASDGAVNGEWRSDWAGLQVGTTSAHYLALRAGNTEQLRIHTDGRGVSQFTAKAWVNFNGSGTVAINDSHNMSSISDNGTGDYTINVSNAMANTNYAVGGSVTYVTGNSSLWMLRDDQTARNTSYWRIFCHSNWTSNDPTSVMQIVFGD